MIPTSIPRVAPLILPVFALADTTVVPPEFYGPAAALVLAITALVILWRDHQRQDVRRDETIDKLTEAVADIPGALRDLSEVVKDATGGDSAAPQPHRPAERPGRRT